MRRATISLRVSAIILAFALLLAPGLHRQADAAARAALVIGNSEYPFGKLINPRNDAKLMASTLKQVGFEVTTVLDADRQTMQKALLDFSRAIRDTDTVGLFYYAGHGAQTGGENYLIPIDADIKAESELKLFGINVDEFVATLERANGRINIVILDSCRNNPFGSGTRSLSRGLAPIDAPTGTFIAYSTSPGQVALDGEGENSPYASALAKSIAAPGTSIEQAFKLARRDVLAATDKAQTPWETSSLTGDFYFEEPAAAPPPEPIAQAKPEPEPDQQIAPQVVTEPALDQPADQDIAINVPPPPEAAVKLRQLEELNLTPRIYPLGKWPEGVAVVGDFIWIAESGSRQIVKLDRQSGAVVAKVPVGRLPVNLVADAKGTVYSAVYTDGKLWSQPASGKGRSLAKFKDYFVGIGVGEGAIFAANYTEADQRTTTLSRIDPASGKVKSSPPQTGEAGALVMAGGAPWLLYRTGELAAYDPKSLTYVAGTSSSAFLWSLTANSQAVYAGGKTARPVGASLVVRHPLGDPNAKTEKLLDGDELILTMAATDARVAALGENGGVWILDAGDLTPLKHFNIGTRPRSAIFADGQLYIVTMREGEDNGSLLVYDGLEQ